MEGHEHEDNSLERKKKKKKRSGFEAERMKYESDEEGHVLSCDICIMDLVQSYLFIIMRLLIMNVQVVVWTFYAPCVKFPSLTKRFLGGLCSLVAYVQSEWTLIHLQRSKEHHSPEIPLGIGGRRGRGIFCCRSDYPLIIHRNSVTLD